MLFYAHMYRLAAVGTSTCRFSHDNPHLSSNAVYHARREEIDVLAASLTAGLQASDEDAEAGL